MRKTHYSFIIFLIIYLFLASITSSDANFKHFPLASDNSAPIILILNTPTDIYLGSELSLSMTYTDDLDIANCRINWTITNDTAVIATTEGLDQTSWIITIPLGASVPSQILNVSVCAIDSEFMKSEIVSHYIAIINRAPIITDFTFTSSDDNNDGLPDNYLNSTFTGHLEVYDTDKEMIRATIQFWHGGLTPWAESLEFYNSSEISFSFYATPGLNWINNSAFPHVNDIIYARVIIRDNETEITAETDEWHLIVIQDRAPVLQSPILIQSEIADGLHRSDETLNYSVDCIDPDGSPLEWHQTKWWYGTSENNQSYIGETLPAGTARVGDTVVLELTLTYAWSPPVTFYSDSIILDVPYPHFSMVAGFLNRTGGEMTNPQFAYVDCYLVMIIHVDNFDELQNVSVNALFYAIRAGVDILAHTYANNSLTDQNVLLYVFLNATNVAPVQAGDFLKVTITVHANSGIDSITASSPFALTNAPPYLISVALPQIIAKNQTEIHCIINACDPDGSDPIYYHIQWFCNGELLVYGGTNLPTAQIVRNDQIFFRVRISNGSEWSEWMVSETRIVQNSPPKILSAAFTSHPSKIAPVTVINYLASDSDFDAVHFRFQFQINGLVLPVSDDPVLSPTLYKIGDVIACKVIAIDDYDAQVSMWLDPIVVENSVPIITMLQYLYPTTEMTLHPTDSLRIYLNFTDVDATPCIVTITWFRNNETLLNRDNTILNTSDATPYNATLLDCVAFGLKAGDVIYAVVQITDGTNTTVYTTDSITIQKTPFIFPTLSSGQYLLLFCGALVALGLFSKYSQKFKRVTTIMSLSTNISLQEAPVIQMFEQIPTGGFRRISVSAFVYSNKVVLASGTILPAATNVDLKKLFTTDTLLAYVSNDEVYPLPRKVVEADVSLMPGLRDSIAAKKEQLQTTIDLYTTSLDLIRHPDKQKNSKNAGVNLQSVLDELLTSETASVNAVLDGLRPSKRPTMLQEKRVNLTKTAQGTGVFQRIQIIDADQQAIPIKARVDNGAEISVISTTVANTHAFQRGDGPIMLSGVVSNQRLPVPVVQINLTIEGKSFTTEAAVYPNLENVVNAPFLIGEPTYREARHAGLKMLD